MKNPLVYEGLKIKSLCQYGDMCFLRQLRNNDEAIQNGLFTPKLHFFLQKEKQSSKLPYSWYPLYALICPSK